MSNDTSFACVTADTGLVSEFLHVSPLFMRVGPTSRGRFTANRLHRTRRTDARHQRRAVAAEPVALGFNRSGSAS